MLAELGSIPSWDRTSNAALDAAIGTGADRIAFIDDDETAAVHFLSAMKCPVTSIRYNLENAMGSDRPYGGKLVHLIKIHDQIPTAGDRYWTACRT